MLCKDGMTGLGMGFYGTYGTEKDRFIQYTMDLLTNNFIYSHY